MIAIMRRRNKLKISNPSTYPSVQCAAVRTCCSSIKDPPQKLLPSIRRAAIHGYENGGGGAPPTIFPWTCSKYLLFDFQREGSVVLLASDSTSPGNNSVVDSVVDVSGSLLSKNERPQIPEISTETIRTKHCIWPLDIKFQFVLTIQMNRFPKRLITIRHHLQKRILALHIGDQLTQRIEITYCGAWWHSESSVLW